MAEQEVIKHTKKAITLWGNKERSIWHKIKDFSLEVIIIVFAITLSIWLHGRSEHSHQQKDVKEFLLGLRDDLTSDIREMEQDKQSFLGSGKAYAYIANRKLAEPLSPDSIQQYYRWYFNQTGLVSNSGRFEGFKSSGKIGLIENTQLQTAIMDLYQEDIPALLMNTNYYNATKARLFEYCTKHMKRLNDAETNLPEVLAADEVYNIATGLADPSPIIERYDICINKSKAIIDIISKRYD